MRRLILVLALLLVAVPAGAQIVQTPEDLVTAPGAVVLGNPDGDVTIVEFFDYQCPACRQSHPAVQEVMAEDGGLRLVYRDWPIFGPPSEEAARLALAARDQGRYEAVHDAFMGISGRLGIDRVRAAARDAGLDLEQAEATLEAKARAIAEHLGTNRLIAEDLGLRGTPAFFIGNYVIPGGLDAAELRRVIADVRAGKDRPPQ